MHGGGDLKGIRHFKSNFKHLAIELTHIRGTDNADPLLTDTVSMRILQFEVLVGGHNVIVHAVRCRDIVGV